MTNYAHAYDEEPLDETDLYDMYDDMLNEMSDNITISDITFNAAEVLKKCDPIAYRCGYHDYTDALLQNGDIIELDD